MYIQFIWALGLSLDPGDYLAKLSLTELLVHE